MISNKFRSFFTSLFVPAACPGMERTTSSLELNDWQLQEREIGPDRRLP